MTTSFIGRYRLETRLGAGEWSECFQAYDLVNRRPVALKLLNPTMLSNERAWRGLLSEIQRSTELVHPHIAWVWETGEEDGRRFLTERFIAGATLENKLAEGGPLPWGQALPLLEQLAQALEFGSARGYRHGRITPHNVLVSREMGAVLSDYGLANALSLLFPERPPTLYNAHFLPPEALQGVRLTDESHSYEWGQKLDSYALACLAVTMLTANPPFAAKDLDEMLARKSRVSAASLLPAASLLSIESTPIPVGEVIARALDPDPSYRFAAATEFAQALSQAIERGLTDESARQQHEEQLQRWRENEEKSRLEAEEASRQKALAEARVEIQQRARQEAERIIALEEELPEPETLTVENAAAGTRQRSRQDARLKRPWAIYGVILAALALGGWWLSERRSSGDLPTSSPTPIHLEAEASTPVLIDVGASPSPFAEVKPSITATSSEAPKLSATPTRRSTAAPSNTPTSSPTVTATQQPPTSTPIRPDVDREFGGGSTP